MVTDGDGGVEDVSNLIEEAEVIDEKEGSNNRPQDDFDHEEFDDKWTITGRAKDLSRREALGLGGGALIGTFGFYTAAIDDSYNPDAVDDRGYVREFNLGADEWTSFNVDHSGARSIWLRILAIRSSLTDRGIQRRQARIVSN